MEATREILAQAGVDLEQTRDWLARSNFDEKESWASLWVMPSKAGCRQAPCCKCNIPLVCIHDCLTCWNCHDWFCWGCVMGERTNPGEVFLSGTDWWWSFAKCLTCGELMGSLAAPTVLRMTFGGQSSIVASFNNPVESPVLLAGKEVDECIRRARLASQPNELQLGIKLYTRALNALNFVYSISPRHFTIGFLDNLFRCHYKRAQLEGNIELTQKLKDLNLKASKRGGTSCATPKSGGRPLTKQGWQDSFLNRIADLEPTLDGTDENTAPIPVNAGPLHGRRPNYSSIPEFGLCGGLQHGFKEWAVQRNQPVNRNDKQPMGVIDIRWLFPSVVAAKDFWLNSEDKLSEKESYQENRRQCSEISIAGADWFRVLEGFQRLPLPTGGSMLVHAHCILLRVDRFCAKVFISWLRSDNSTTLRTATIISEKAIIRMKAALESSKEAKTLEACMCGHPGKYLCSKCKAVRYCSSECQTIDWPAHKETCTWLSKNGQMFNSTFVVNQYPK